MEESPKNSISILHEFCQATKWLYPQFKLLGDEYETNMTYFIMTCTVFDKVTQGIGNSKKLAKLAAADKMIELLKSEGILYTTDLQKKDQKPLDILCKRFSDLKIQANPVGLLQEYCMDQRLPLPEYTDTLMITSGFTIVCKMNDQSCKGYGRKRKLAKADAARKMCELLFKNLSEKNETIDAVKDESGAYVNHSNTSVKQVIVKSECMYTVSTEENENEP